MPSSSTKLYLVTLLAAVLLAGYGTGCTIGGDPIDQPDPDPDPDPDPNPNPDPNPDPDPGIVTLAGDIDADATWSGTVQLTEDSTILAGVQITMAPNTRLEGAMGAWLQVQGSLVVDGSAAEPVVMTPTDSAGGWAGIKALSGGSVSLSNVDVTKAAVVLRCESGASHCSIADSNLHGIGKAVEIFAVATIDRTHIEDMSNAGISLGTGGTLTITDTTMLTSTHDVIVANGGDLIVDHSHVGDAQGSYEHCNFHIGSSSSVLVTNSVISDSIYGLMLGNSAAATFNNNNFTGNDPGNDVLDLGGNSNVDMTQNYWDQGAPSLGAAFDTSAALPSPVAGAGPR